MNHYAVETPATELPKITAKSTLGDLARTAVILTRDAVLKDVQSAFFASPGVKGIVVLGQAGKDPDLISRHRFTDFQSRPFFDELFATRPIDYYLRSVPEEALVFEAQAPIYEVAELALGRDGDDVYAPIIVEPTDDRPAMLVDMRDLIRAQADILRASSRTANEALSRFLKSQEELLQSRKMEAVGTLSAGLAHELNTPLQFLGSNVSFLETLHEEYEASFTSRPLPDFGETFVEDWCEEFPGAIKDMRTGITRIAEIVAAMKTFSDQDGANCGDVDVNSTIETAVALVRGRIAGNADLGLGLADGLPTFQGVSNALTQAWVNILTNALQAIEGSPTNDRGTITVTSRAIADGRIVLAFSDTGVGMDEETAKRCLEPFFTTRPPGQGTGQGLTTAHRAIVLEHKGTIRVESRPGHGTTVHVVLPAAPPPGDRQTTRSIAPV